MTGQHFDQLVFGGTVVVERENGKTITRSPNKLFRPNLENAYAKEIEQLAKECKLSDEQRKKLQLAARGDVVRLMNRIDVLRQKTINTELSQAEYPALVSELQGFSFASRLMISNPSSLFRKSLRRCLTDEQVVLYAAAEHNRQIAMLERALDQLGRPSASGNFIESSLDQLEEELMPRKLTPEARRKKFVEIMLANTRIPPASHPYAIQIIFLEAGKQEELLEPVFTQSQWENFQRQVKNARRVENGLQLMGVWPLRTRDEEAELGDEDGN